MGINNSAKFLGAGISISTEIEVMENIYLRPKKIEIDHIDLMDHTVSKQEYGMICSISDSISFELETIDPDPKQLAIRSWNSQWILVFLSCILKKPIFHPISEFQNSGKPYYKMSNYYFSRKIFDKPHVLSKEEIALFLSHIEKFMGMADNRLVHATSVAAHVHSEMKTSIGITAIWSGIEALLDVDHELSFRIALLCSKILGKTTEDRERIFLNTKRLYGIRSKCVHGSFSDKKKINEKEAFEDSLNLLCDLILFFSSRGHMMTEDEKRILILK